MGEHKTDQPSDAVLPGVTSSSTVIAIEAQVELPTINSLTKSSTDSKSPAVDHAFSSQLDIPSPSVDSSASNSGAYNMAAMAQAMPVDGYAGGQYHRQPQRYDQLNQAHLLHQMSHIPQYTSNHSMPATTQSYYLHQQGPMPSYYGHPSMHQPHVQHGISSRQHVPYYPHQMMMGQPQPSPYYYSHSAQFQGHSGMAPSSTMNGGYSQMQATLVDGRYHGQMVDGNHHMPHTQAKAQGNLLSPSLWLTSTNHV